MSTFNPVNPTTATITTAARVFSRYDSIEELHQRTSRSGSAIGIVPVVAAQGEQGARGSIVAATGVGVGSSAGIGSGVGTGGLYATAGARNVPVVGSGNGNGVRIAGSRSGSIGAGLDDHRTVLSPSGTGTAAAAAVGGGGVSGGIGIGGSGSGSSGGTQLIGGATSTVPGRLSISSPSGAMAQGAILGVNDFPGTGLLIVGSGVGVASSGGGAGVGQGSVGTGAVSGGAPKRQGSFSNVFLKLIDGMPAGTMFSKFKSANTASTSLQNITDANPISQYFKIGEQVACAGPELVWRIHDGYRKSDGKACSIFVFEKKIAEKLLKPRRKEIVTELLKNSVKTMDRFRHPKILQVLHTVEESTDTLAFAAEPVFASLSNILAFHESKTYEHIAMASNAAGTGPQNYQLQATAIPQRPAHAKEYNFLDIEFKYGCLQLVEALSYLHYSGHVIHRNVCPSSILVTKRGTWKLAGLEFIERMNATDVNELVPCPPWSNRVSKMAQPNLDFMAPETQLTSKGSLLSDMFSLGLVICAVFNNGRPLIQAGNIVSNYMKQLETLEESVQKMLPRVPLPLQAATSRLVSKDATARPTAQLLQLIKYFIDPAANALKFLDVVNMNDKSQKSHFYKNTLMEVLPLIPRKLWWQNLWPMLQAEISNGEMLAAVLQPTIRLIQEASPSEYESIMAPTMKIIFSSPKSIQATVTLLENLHLITEKTAPKDVTTDIIPILFFAFESSIIKVQSAAVVAVTNVFDNIEDVSIRRMVVPKVKSVFEKNLADRKIVQNVLICIEGLMDKLERAQVMKEVLQLLGDVRIPDPDIVMHTVHIYHKMVADKTYGLTVETMAIHVLPLLVPHTVNPGLNLEQYCMLVEVLQEMLEQIDRQQRNKLKLDNLSIPSPECHRPLRHQFSSDTMNAPPFNIPNLRIDQRKTSSAENMAQKNSGARLFTGSGMLGGSWFGCSLSSPDSNFPRAANAFPNWRLSDNTLKKPKTRIAPSCASLPGGTPGSGLPTLRHSSIGPQERRVSTINLSPPTLEESVQKMLPRVPLPLQAATSRLVNKDATARPTAQLLQLTKYFIDPAASALKFSDMVNMNDKWQISHFYKNTLMEALPLIPRKLWWQNVWPMLQAEISSGEVLAAVLQPTIRLIQEASPSEYESIMAPTMKIIFSSPKSIQATVTLLENLHLITEKTAPKDVTTDIIPMLFSAFESSIIKEQSAAVVAVTNVFDNIEDVSIRRMVVPKVKSVLEKNLADRKIVQNVLICIEGLMDKLERAQVMKEVLQLLGDVRIPDPDIVMHTVHIYQKMVADKKYGLTVETMAIHELPLLIPHTVNPGLNLEQYCMLVEVLQEMLEQIDRQQRIKLKLDNLSIPSPECHRPLRHQFSSDNMNAPPFNIPNLRIDQRKTFSAEGMAQKNSGGSGMLGGSWFGCSLSSPDSNFPRAANAFPNWRLSDNTLKKPKTRIAPSCASSPGGTPGSGLPTLRHSSIGPQERRGSTINLSPPTDGSMANTSSSVPFLLSSSMPSIRSRRTSTVHSSGPLGCGSGILQKLGSGMCQLFFGRT
ncbi:uncharacterized protein LOC128862025 isoform X3 [Anastrepha ludens]|uniref:uncharacterized protein LOC128862025 isoform X3 n=1 Tax=Anastrepha ludens TaxID=28586 RepID=UPI0023B1B6D1|nr:uncharacterized protein LOC128862025 isoform X3 [Anastrepha ludens]